MVDLQTGDNTVDTVLVINVLRNRINDQEYERALLIAQNQALMLKDNQNEQLIRNQSEMIAELQALVDQTVVAESGQVETELPETEPIEEE